MTDAELAALKALADAGEYGDLRLWEVSVGAVRALIAEVERLRAELASHKRHAAYVANIIEDEGRYMP